MNILKILEKIMWLMNIVERVFEETILVGEYSKKYFWKKNLWMDILEESFLLINIFEDIFEYF